MNVKSLCLGSLCLKDFSGYEIKKLFESAFNHFYSASYGSIYPSLTKLLDEGLVTVTIQPGDRHPDKKIFSVTAEGREEFINQLSITPPVEQLRSGFLMLMFFAHLLETERLIEIMDEIEQRYTDEIDYLNTIQACEENTAGMRFTVDFGLASYQHALHFIQQNRDKLISNHQQEKQS